MTGKRGNAGRRLAALLLAAALLAGLVAAAQAAKDDVFLVSRASGAAGEAGDESSSEASISSDGRLVAFRSSADNLSGDDNDSFEDVFVRDLQANTTTFVSRVSGATGAAGDGHSSDPAVSADGRFVAFSSTASNLSGEDADAVGGRFVRDVFVRDLPTGVTTYVSRASGAAGTAGDDDSFLPSISADGRFVAFDSDASSISAEDKDPESKNDPVIRDVFVRDVQANTTTLVSRASGVAGVAGDASSSGSAISADGRFVAFRSDADNLSGDDNDAVANVFVRDLETNTTTYLSRASGAAGTAGDGDSGGPSISADGRLVAFDSGATNLSDEDGPLFDVFVRDLETGTTTYVSRAGGTAGTAGDDHSFSPSISADGRFVVFTSEADSLSSEDNDAIDNIFVRDLQTNATTYVNRASGAAGAPGDGDSEISAISGDGRFVAFDATADNLSGEDDDAVTNVFVRDVLGPPPLPPAPAAPSPTADAADTTGPAISARALSRANGTIRVSRSGRFTLFCGRYSEPVTGRCGGQSARPVAAAQRRRKRILRLGTRRFTAAAGQRAPVRFRLSRANLKRLKTAKKVRMRGTVVVRDAVGNATTARFRFALRAPEPNRRRGR